MWTFLKKIGKHYDLHNPVSFSKTVVHFVRICKKINELKETQYQPMIKEKRKECIFLTFVVGWENSFFWFGTEFSSHSRNTISFYFNPNFVSHNQTTKNNISCSSFVLHLSTIILTWHFLFFAFFIDKNCSCWEVFAISKSLFMVEVFVFFFLFFVLSFFHNLSQAHSFGLVLHKNKKTGFRTKTTNSNTFNSSQGSGLLNWVRKLRAKEWTIVSKTLHWNCAQSKDKTRASWCGSWLWRANWKSEWYFFGSSSTHSSKHWLMSTFCCCKFALTDPKRWASVWRSEYFSPQQGCKCTRHHICSSGIWCFEKDRSWRCLVRIVACVFQSQCEGFQLVEQMIVEIECKSNLMYDCWEQCWNVLEIWINLMLLNVFGNGHNQWENTDLMEVVERIVMLLCNTHNLWLFVVKMVMLTKCWKCGMNGVNQQLEEETTHFTVKYFVVQWWQFFQLIQQLFLRHVRCWKSNFWLNVTLMEMFKHLDQCWNVLEMWINLMLLNVFGNGHNQFENTDLMEVVERIVMLLCNTHNLWALCSKWSCWQSVGSVEWVVSINNWKKRQHTSQWSISWCCDDSSFNSSNNCFWGMQDVGKATFDWMWLWWRCSNTWRNVEMCWSCWNLNQFDVVERVWKWSQPIRKHRLDGGGGMDCDVALQYTQFVTLCSKWSCWQSVGSVEWMVSINNWKKRQHTSQWSISWCCDDSSFNSSNNCFWGMQDVGKATFDWMWLWWRCSNTWRNVEMCWKFESIWCCWTCLEMVTTNSKTQTWWRWWKGLWCCFELHTICDSLWSKWSCWQSVGSVEWMVSINNWKKRQHTSQWSISWCCDDSSFNSSNNCFWGM